MTITSSLRLAAVGALSLGLLSAAGPADPAPLGQDRLAGLHALIKPQAGELRFHEIPWLIDVWEARRKAAAEGKPILAWSGAGGAPLGVC